jgi:hypothetical protein
MADRYELGAEDQEALEEWCRAQMETPVVTVSLTESERVRLAARVRETFDGDAGLLRGLDATDVSLLSKMGIDVRRPSTAESEQSMVEVLSKGHFNLLGTIGGEEKERLRREGAESRAKLRTGVKLIVRTIKRVLDRYGHGHDPYTHRVSAALYRITALLETPELTLPDAPLEQVDDAVRALLDNGNPPPLSFGERARRVRVRDGLAALVEELDPGSGSVGTRYGESLRLTREAIERALATWGDEPPNERDEVRIRTAALTAWRAVAPHAAVMGRGDKLPGLKRTLQKVLKALEHERGCATCGDEHGTCTHKLDRDL